MPRSGCSALHGVNPNLKKSLEDFKIKLEDGNQMDVTVNYAKTLCQI